MSMKHANSKIKTKISSATAWNGATSATEMGRMKTETTSSMKYSIYATMCADQRQTTMQVHIDT
jgi:hypothetical protein